MFIDFNGLCSEHDLTCISTMWNTAFNSRALTVYIHWDRSGCASASGNTFEEAFSAAIKEMAILRPEETEVA